MQAAALTLDAAAPREAGAWDALDDAAEWQSFSQAAPGGGQWTSYIAIEGMWCAACTLAVEDALAGCRGVRGVQVNGATATARVTWAPGEGRPSDWWRSLQRAGYGATPAGDMLTSAPRRRAQRMLLWRWLVAGFCMMQVMMYAVPVYIAQPGDMTPDIERLLHWASWLMTLPVLLFSCIPFFRSAWRDVRHGRVGMDVPVVLGILIAFGASSAATFDPGTVLGGEVWFDSITMFVFFLLSGRLLEQRLRDRTAGALEALARRLPDMVERANAAGDWERVATRRLQPGDRIRVRPGEAVPADGEVVEGASRFDEALLTGESRPVARGTGESVVAGSHNLESPVVVRVTRCGADTRFAQVVALMERASADKPRIAQLADRFATPFLVAVIAAAAAAGAWWWPAGPAHAIGVAIAVLIVTCPCALSLATPAATLAAAGALARRGILVQRLQAIEDCAGVDTVVFDKTGTLTQPHLAVTAVRTRGGIERGEAFELAAALAQHSLHPASRALAAATPRAQARNVREVTGHGLEGDVVAGSGAGTRHVRLGSASWCGAPEPVSAASAVHLADASGWLASFDLGERLADDAQAAVRDLRELGLAVELLSGDRARAVQAVAARAGIDAAHGGHTPESKLEHVARLQARGSHVAMVGDGMNDGPVLARAAVSIAMGQGVPLAQAQSDFIVPGSQVGAVPRIVRLARRTRAVVRENLAWAAAYNAVCVPLAAAGWMPPWLAGLGMAASSLIVVANAARLAGIPKG
jgi:Cu2+-exporting ATPase